MDQLLAAAVECFCTAASWHRASGRPLLARALVARAAELLAHHAAHPGRPLDERAARALAPGPRS